MFQAILYLGSRLAHKLLEQGGLQVQLLQKQIWSFTKLNPVDWGVFHREISVKRCAGSEGVDRRALLSQEFKRCATNLTKFQCSTEQHQGCGLLMISMVSYGTTKRTLSHDDSNVPRLRHKEQKKAGKFDVNSGSQIPGMWHATTFFLIRIVSRALWAHSTYSTRRLKSW